MDPNALRPQYPDDAAIPDDEAPDGENVLLAGAELPAPETGAEPAAEPETETEAEAEPATEAGAGAGAWAGAGADCSCTKFSILNI